MATVNTNRKEAAPKKRGRPPKNASRVDGNARKTRVPVSGQRDILAVLNKDPAYEYRFVLDVDERGSRIIKFINAGYEFCKYEEDLGVGSDMVYHSENVGSIVRIPSQGGKFLYLMKQHRDYFTEDQAAKQRHNDELEQGAIRERDTEKDDGMYGEGEFYR